jgi:hypothetical protein
VNREIGVQVEPEPEWDGPDPLMEMVKHAHRMVPESKVCEAVAAERSRIAEAVRGLPLRGVFGEGPGAEVIGRVAVLTIVEPTGEKE